LWLFARAWMSATRSMTRRIERKEAAAVREPVAQ
jgi:hypothetical protein